MICPLYDQACAVTHRSQWSVSVPAVCAEAARAALLSLHRHSHAFRETSGHFPESGGTGSCISQREGRLGARESWVGHTLVCACEGADGPHRSL